MTYSGLIQSIAKWINRTNGEADDVIAQQIIESQYELEKKFPLWFLIDEYVLTITEGMSSVVLPNYAIKLLDAEIIDEDNVRNDFTVVPAGIFRQRHPLTTDTGRPEHGVIRGHSLQFAPEADASYTLRLHLHHHLDPLDLSTNTSNEWTTTYLSILRYKVLVDMEAYIGEDDRMATWRARLAECEAALKGEIADNELAGLQEIMTETENLYS